MQQILKWLARAFTGRQVPSRRPQPARLAVEALEDRMVPTGWNTFNGSVSSLSTGHDAYGHMVLAEIDYSNAVSVQVETAANSNVFGPPQALGSTARDVRVALDRQGRVEIFTRNMNYSLTAWTLTGSVSTSAQNLGGVALLQIEVGSNQDGRLEAFALGSDHAVYHKWQDIQGNWGSWAYLGGNAQSISVAQDAQKRLQVVALWADGSARVIGQTQINGGWGAWTSLGGWQLQQLAVANDNNGNLTVFALGGNGSVYVQQEALNGTWGGWSNSNLGGNVLSIAAGRNAAGQLEVVATGKDLNVYTIRQTTAGGEWRNTGWGPWSGSIGGTLWDNRVVLGNEANGTLDVFADIDFIDDSEWAYITQ